MVGDKMSNFIANQRRFAVLGDNIFQITNKLAKNKRLCQLLVNTGRNPFDPKLAPVNGDDLIGRNILIVPKIPDDPEQPQNLKEELSYIVVMLSQFQLNPLNKEFKDIWIRFDIVCPQTQWALDEPSARPYLMMQEIDMMFNEQRISGIGRMQFLTAYPLVLSGYISGYTMQYGFDQFN